jgi:hypothetical protein
MKKTLVCLMIFLIIIAPVSVFAIEFLWTDKHGNRHFDCGGLFAGGTAIIKEQAKGVYRAKSVLIDRQIRAHSIYHAGQVACGEKPEPEEKKPVTDAEANKK